MEKNGKRNYPITEMKQFILQYYFNNLFHVFAKVKEIWLFIFLLHETAELSDKMLAISKVLQHVKQNAWFV